MKPHGRLAFVCWRDLKENLWASLSIAAARDLVPAQPPADPFAPGPYAFADGERLKNILARAGYRNIRIEKLDTTVNMGATPEDAAAQALNIGPLARAATGLDEATRDKIRAVVSEALSKYQTAAGITPPAACWLVGAGV